MTLFVPAFGLSVQGSDKFRRKSYQHSLWHRQMKRRRQYIAINFFCYGMLLLNLPRGEHFNHKGRRGLSIVQQIDQPRVSRASFVQNLQQLYGGIDFQMTTWLEGELSNKNKQILTFSYVSPPLQTKSPAPFPLPASFHTV